MSQSRTSSAPVVSSDDGAGWSQQPPPGLDAQLGAGAPDSCRPPTPPRPVRVAVGARRAQRPPIPTSAPWESWVWAAAGSLPTSLCGDC